MVPMLASAELAARERSRALFPTGFISSACRFEDLCLILPVGCVQCALFAALFQQHLSVLPGR